MYFKGVTNTHIIFQIIDLSPYMNPFKIIKIFVEPISLFPLKKGQSK